MTLRLRHLRLRAFTQDGVYGADFPFEAGLNVIWADNTKGKSTSMQALLYVLGMEKMLSPSREVPVYTRVRTIRSDLLGPSSAPSAAAVEERVRIEARIRDLEGLIASLGDTASRLHILSAEFVELLNAGRLLPSDKMTADDKDKLDALTGSVRELAQTFGFTTFAPKDLTIDEDSYRPQKEGYEIGFETSASDAIRLKWAYQLGLLELARNYTTNHPGMLLLDEPRQQSSSKVSFGQLLERAASHRGTGQQVIVSTSEDIDTLTPILARLSCKKIIFDGYVLQPVEEG